MEQVLHLQQQAVQAAGSLQGLMLAADQVAKAVQTGAHGRRRAGFGESFWQFRDYDSQESASRIDWRQSAKRDRLAVREQEWDAVQTAYIWLDDTASMDYKSEARATKLVTARVLALAIANLMMRGGESVGTLDMAVRPGANKLKTEELAHWLCQPRNKDLVDSDKGLRPVPAHAQQIWFSDFLMPPAELELALAKQTQNRQAGVLVHVFDPSEVALPFKGRTRFRGLEGEADWTVQKTEGVTALYDQRWRQHCETLQKLARAAGWSVLPVNTGQALSQPLAKLYSLLANGAGVSR